MGSLTSIVSSRTSDNVHSGEKSCWRVAVSSVRFTRFHREERGEERKKEGKGKRQRTGSAREKEEKEYGFRIDGTSSLDVKA